MLGAFPRKDGMERKDLLEKNCGIFKEQVPQINRKIIRNFSQLNCQFQGSVSVCAMANLHVYRTVLFFQGDFLNTVASKTVKVLVVGNPANTNALIAAECAPNIPKGKSESCTMNGLSSSHTHHISLL